MILLAQERQKNLFKEKSISFENFDDGGSLQKTSLEKLISLSIPEKPASLEQNNEDNKKSNSLSAANSIGHVSFVSGSNSKGKDSKNSFKTASFAKRVNLSQKSSPPAWATESTSGNLKQECDKILQILDSVEPPIDVDSKESQCRYLIDRIKQICRLRINIGGCLNQKEEDTVKFINDSTNFLSNLVARKYTVDGFQTELIRLIQLHENRSFFSKFLSYAKTTKNLILLLQLSDRIAAVDKKNIEMLWLIKVHTEPLSIEQVFLSGR